MLKVGYLSLYNVACFAGWAYILYAILLLISQGRLTKLWKEYDMVIKIVQSSAALEIGHSLIGLVKSPIMRALPQVSSRLFIVWFFMDSLYTHPFQPLPKDDGCESLEKLDVDGCTEDRAYQIGAMMLIAWCCAELIRYSFYFFNTIDPKLVPKPIVWLRYSGFLILYPIGISGEIMTAYNTLPLLKKGLCPPLGGLDYVCPSNAVTLLYCFLAMYVPFGPYLYMSMLSERKKRLYPKPAPKLQGVVFPVSKGSERSTTSAAKEIFAAAIKPVDPAAADKVKKEKNWRFGYTKYVKQNLIASAKSEKAALAIAKAGLDHMYNSFDFITDQGTTKFAEALKSEKGSYKTHTIKGSAPRPSKFEIKVPYKCYHTGEFKELSGNDLIQQIHKWVDYGTIEPDCGEALKEVVINPQYCDLQGQYFVLLGTTSAMGPFRLLSSLGAHIIAVDLDRPQIWNKILSTVKETCGAVTFPIKEDFKGQEGEELYKIAGCNLMNDTPKVCNWLKETVPKVCGGKPVTVGGYAYLDGELHVRVNLACDAAMAAVVDSYGPKNVRLANLCTPTDAYLIPDDARKAVQQNLKEAPLYQKLLSMFLNPLGQKLAPNLEPLVKADDGTEFAMMDGLVVAQGPNYALAKRLQQWRAVMARAAGCTVSLNIAPATATVSVVHNKQFAMAYGGTHHFKPMEIFYQEVSNAVMGGLLIYDISSPKSAANPSTKLENALMLQSKNAFHGGAMRCLYKFTSIGEVAVLLFLLQKYLGIISLLLLVGLGAYARSIS